MWIGGAEDPARASAADALKAMGLKPKATLIGKTAKVFEQSEFEAVECCCCAGKLRVPRFVCCACAMLRRNARLEGLFRRAGSAVRQRDMERAIRAGGSIEDSWPPVDVACLLKLYLRTLPEPVLGDALQDLLLACNSHRARRLATLLMPQPLVHLFHYIMEFLQYISTQCAYNKMDSDNLAIIMAPTIMPLPSSCPPQRLQQHVKLVKFFIENASIIGIVPDDILNVSIDKTRKKRRSGSLTRMFTGLRKIVSSSAVKPVNLDAVATPVIDKSAKKRSQLVEMQGFSAKKRKEIVNAMPSTKSMLTPMNLKNKSRKKTRLSIGGRKSKERLSPLDRATSSPSREPKKSAIDDEKTLDSVDNTENDYVRISKREYEAIKNRVSAIENRISQEFNSITGVVDRKRATTMESVERVQTVYEKTLEEAAVLSSPGSEHLARRLSRELKIRQPDECKIIRSPSARKIGTIRRRSRENVTRLTRTQTWTASSPRVLQTSNVVKNAPFCPNSGSLKRGRPNTVNTGLVHPVVVVHHNPAVEPARKIITDEAFQDSYNTRGSNKRASSFHGTGKVSKPFSSSNFNAQDINWTNAKTFMMSADNLDNPLTGRASVAKLRNQMAGMVLAKARLFDAMTDSDSSLEKQVNKKPKQSTGFARKSRKHISVSQDESNKPVANVNTSNDSSLSSVEYQNFKKVPDKSPGFVSKRHKTRIVRSPSLGGKMKENLNLSTQLKDVIYEVCTPLSEKLTVPLLNGHVTTLKVKESVKANGGYKSPRGTPHLKRSLAVKSVGNIKNVQCIDMKKANTPLRANHNTPRRQSPRIMKVKL